jgi:hypothetical protein
LLKWANDSISGPIGALSMVIFYLAWPKAEYLPTIERISWKQLDFLGSFLLLAAAVLLVFPFQNVGSDTEKWGTAVFIAPLIVGVLCWAGLVFWEVIVDKRWNNRIAAAFPIRLFRSRVYSSSILSTLLTGFPYLLVIYAFPQRVQVVNGQTSLTAGLMLLPMLGASAVGSSIAGAINARKNVLFECLMISTALVLLGCGLLTTLAPTEEVEAKTYGFLVFLGFGFGMAATASTIYASSESSIPDHGRSSHLKYSSRLYTL